MWRSRGSSPTNASRRRSRRWRAPARSWRAPCTCSSSATAHCARRSRRGQPSSVSRRRSPGFAKASSCFECYAAADLFVLLSRREPWGTVVNEAAAFGLPLVLADTVGAAADLLRPDENGVLVRNGDIEGSARAIARLADDELRERAGRRSAEVVSAWGYEPSIEPFVAAVRRAAREGSLIARDEPRR